MNISIFAILAVSMVLAVNIGGTKAQSSPDIETTPSATQDLSVPQDESAESDEPFPISEPGTAGELDPLGSDGQGGTAAESNTAGQFLSSDGEPATSALTQGARPGRHGMKNRTTGGGRRRTTGGGRRRSNRKREGAGRERARETAIAQN